MESLFGAEKKNTLKEKKLKTPPEKSVKQNMV